MTDPTDPNEPNSPLPWASLNKSDPRAIFDALGNRCATAGSNMTSLEQDEWLAAHIIRCVNVHEELVAIVKELLHASEALGTSFTSPMADVIALDLAQGKARAALAKAGK